MEVKIDGDPRRYETKNYPEAAIREAVVNAFVHRDYMLHSTIKIEIFDDRMEILSLGGIPDGLTLEEVKDGMTTVWNPQLVHILDKLKYIENTGIRRMYEAYNGTNKLPEFEVRPNSFKVLLPNVNWRKNQVDKSDKKDNLSEETVLFMLEKNGKQTRKELQQVLGTTPYHVRKLLNELIEQGKVKKTGKSVNTRYEKR